MRGYKSLSIVALGALLGGGLAIQGFDDRNEKEGNDSDQHPDGRGMAVFEIRTASPASAATNPPITYHGGPVLTGTVNVYYIWYGNWAGNTAATILTDFANSIGNSPYFNINKGYYNGSNTHVSGAVHLAGSTTDNYSQGTSLADSAIRSVVSSAISSGRLPKDTSGVYFVFTSQDVTATSGFCTKYCGWHTRSTISGSDIKYSFVGNVARCPTSCSAFSGSTTPNGNLGADGMASILAHELEETVTDPDLNAWFDSRGAENADKCAWTFGTTYTTANGSKANVKLGTRDFLIQQNWVLPPAGGTGFCSMQ